ncbi:orange carotenoid protein [Phormidesmis priestleyi ULC007]|uniref:Orange carotenoid protein n=1 Tax=Phormidesmis priestleyi ULC007 TaxID=1920490 RepID=A0A2T1DHC5_9CYAN|nr:orange carotenoid protein N-terminal domain-containing protein [Phormidesmis priestleyi]PSB19873.1 orange carotenoid protein [Phormidesmis priestleyi ULC007]PZO49200.1 MAG: orange carotenoid protein [Phormidesmis priestleyi]
MVESANHGTVRSQYVDEPGQKAIGAYDKLDTDGKLAFLYYVYEKMGDSITPAAPAAAEPELAPILLGGSFYNLSHDDQLNVMRDIVSGADSEYSRNYGALKENNQLVVWYAWAQAMGESVVGMPEGYSASEAITSVLGQVEKLDFDQQISLLREIAGTMGYTDVQEIPTQAQTGKTASL